MKRINILLSIVLAAAVGLFAAYLMWIHNNLDTVGPVITIADQMLEVSVSDSDAALLQGISAEDARDGDVSASLLVESVYGITDEKIATVTYAAFDKAGNVSKVERQVRYRDYEAPRFFLTRNMCFPSGSGFNLLDYIGATDVLEGDISRRVRATLVSDTKSINEVGSHLVRLQVTNSLGDTTEADIPVEVYDPEWYTAAVELDSYMIYLKRGEVFDAMEHLETFVVRGEDIDIRYEIPEDISLTISDQVNTRIPGVYQVKYILSKNINLVTFSGQAVLIVVVTE